MTGLSVIFDMGNVLIDWDPRAPYARHLSDSAALDAFFEGFFWDIYNAVHDDPRPMAACLAPLKRAHPDKVHLIELYEKDWASFLNGPIIDSVALVEELAEGGVPLYGLTNWPHQVWPPSAHVAPDERAGYAFLDLFADIVVSGQERLRKPDPALYALALERFKLAPADAVFVDDLRANVDAAREIGIQAIHFIGADALRAELAGLGLLARRP